MWCVILVILGIILYSLAGLTLCHVLSRLNIIEKEFCGPLVCIFWPIVIVLWVFMMTLLGLNKLIYLVYHKIFDK
jgi:hypothetical protein